MNIKDFAERHVQSCPPIQQTVRRWALERQVDDFLNISLMPGFMIADLFIGDQLRLADFPPVSQDILDAFSKLMGAKADSYEEVRSLILDKIEKGESSVWGLTNKIQGQFGENLFVAASEGKASLASLGNQESWDVSVDHGDFTQYVQVKVYEDPNKVMEKILEVQEKLKSGSIAGVNGEAVESIDFAVNSDIVDEVRREVSERGIDINILDMGSTQEEIRSQLLEGFANASVSPFENLFGELFEGVLAVGSIHLAICAFQIYFQAKDRNQAIEDALYRVAVAAGAGAAGLAAEALVLNAALLLKIEVVAVYLAGPIGVIGGIGAAVVLRRVSNRRFVVQRLAENNERQRQLLTALQAV
ncbi:MAG TPA: hypothetical protein VE954_13505 [Oligoflexus sp.]|uniref:hypothetical protein n=1 Tax=Oligoflexus sp. TaxID=1971216 RepID=UPI002D672592|nr:hypothetical protein [Oligoflexus sp.]HYX34119.1 hypothetical protein [Oligoflexus sp.]